ncbi:MAG: hypothetical protein MJA84_07100 [Firmicutes bacterium]|nr:hypothetical protein [Bacillota bacterium]
MDEPYFYLAGNDSYAYTLDQLVDVTGSPNDNSLLAYMTLVGQQVTVKDDSAEITGLVEKVLLENGDVMVTVDGSNYSVGQIIELQSRPKEPTAHSGGGETPAGGAGTGEQQTTEV